MEKDEGLEYQRLHDEQSIKRSMNQHLKYMQVKDRYTATMHDYYIAAASSVWDRLVEGWIKTQQRYYKEDRKRVYYLSLEYLLGRSLVNNMVNMGIKEPSKNALDEMGLSLEELAEFEPDAGLGNGGLGRLAACFLDSMATLGIAGYGYGIRYQYGIFRQRIEDGEQVEEPDNWLKFGNPWEVARPEYAFDVKFGGNVEVREENGKKIFDWKNAHVDLAIPYDTPVAGYGGNTVNTLRLWSASSSKEFDLDIFNHGDYVKAVEDKDSSELISKVLYPNDNIIEGKELRLKQQYFFVSASVQDIVRRYKKAHSNFEQFAEKVAIQLNDTHPTLAIPELMRILIDDEGLGWEDAWKIVSKVFAYTNHTVLPEALERWPVELVERLLPRHMQIIYEINHRFLLEVRARFPNDDARARRMSIIEEGPVKQVRMAHLAIVGSHKVNGVAQLHSEILKNKVFRDFFEIWPEKFTNVTNGITQRRWLLVSNPSLAKFITSRIGDGWTTDLTQLKCLEKYANDKSALEELMKIKRSNKHALSNYILKTMGIEVDPDSIFDVHVKRFHEYKRQLLNAMHIMMLYNRLKANPGYDMVPRTFIFGGKSAPGYFIAKRIIALINALAEKINNDPKISGKLKVIFLEDYRVSLSEKIIPATDVSEQISTAGKEASGTGNMKFALNGAITLGTMDGANIEIREEVGDDNIFVFGLTAHEVESLKSSGKYNPWEYYNRNPEIRQLMSMLESGELRPSEPGYFRPIYDSIMHGDEYLLLADLESYANAQKKIDEAYRDKKRWAKMALLNIARIGKFSSDRSIMDYANGIWNVKYDQPSNGEKKNGKK